MPASDVPSYVPVAQHLGACSAAQISAYVAACDSGSPAACDTWASDPANAACITCIDPLTDAGAPTNAGALLFDVTGHAFFNLPGCLAVADGNTSCAAPLESYLQCVYYACDSCYGNWTAFPGCNTEAQMGACAGYYSQLAPCGADYADGGTAYVDCNNDDISAIVNVICGAGPVGGGG